MSAQVEAAIIAGCFGVLTLIGTLIVQIRGFRLTRASTREQIEATHTDTASTLRAQGYQLARTLREQRGRTLNERFATAADKLGGDRPPAVRLAGVHAMAGLADDWKESRQTCVDVLCAYLRLPFEADPGEGADSAERIAFRADREVRHTVISIIGAHLRPGAPASWQGLCLNFTGTVFDGGDFSGAVFAGGEVSFQETTFAGGYVSFRGAVFSGATVSFAGAEFAGDKTAGKGNVLDFSGARFTGGKVTFGRARFSGGTVYFGRHDDRAFFTSGEVSFDDAEFTGSDVTFCAEFSGSTVAFERARFSGGRVLFGRKGMAGAEFRDGTVSFRGSVISGSAEVCFDHSKFRGAHVGFFLASVSGGRVSFHDAEFTDGDVNFGATFSDGMVDFGGARFSGGNADFRHARFTGGKVDFTKASAWSRPPSFSWDGSVPAAVMLPAAATEAEPVRRSDAGGHPAEP
jgi:uncharacterized protein YjbI with pentapeptide repeats